MGLNQEYGSPYKGTATAASSTATSPAAATGKVYYITDIAGSSDLTTATLQVKDGSTVIWQQLIGTTPYKENFTQPLECTSGNQASVVVTGTSTSTANIAGFSTP